jgi:hypothetical protein
MWLHPDVLEATLVKFALSWAAARWASHSAHAQDFHKAMEAWTIDFKGTDSRDWLRNSFILLVCALLVNASLPFPLISSLIGNASKSSFPLSRCSYADWPIDISWLL